MKRRRLYTPPILFYCEGSDDAKFVRVLKKAFGNPSHFKVMQGAGSSVDYLLDKCSRESSEYVKYCVVDAIPIITEQTYNKAKNLGIEIIAIEPFLECIILSFLSRDKKYLSGPDRHSAKQQFKNQCRGFGYESIDDIVLTKEEIMSGIEFLGGFEKVIKLLREEKERQSNFDIQ